MWWRFLAWLPLAAVAMWLRLRPDAQAWFGSLETTGFGATSVFADWPADFPRLLNLLGQAFTVFAPAYLPTLVAAAVLVYLLKWRDTPPFEPSLQTRRTTFVIVWIALLAVHYGVFKGAPFSVDEMAYLYQADIMGHGRAKGPPPPVGPPFRSPNIVQDESGTFSKYPPGWSLLLAPWRRIGLEGVVPTAAGAWLLVLLASMAARRGGVAAWWIALLGIGTSPLFVGNASTFHAHVPHALGLILWMEAASPIAGAVAMWIRPFETVLVMSAWLLVHRPARTARLVAGIAIAAALLAIWNVTVTGTLSGQAYGRTNVEEYLGFGAYGHNGWRALWNLTYAALRAAWWSLPLALVAGLYSRDGRLVAGLAIAGGMLFWYNNGEVEFGPRYYFVPAVLLATAAAGMLGRTAAPAALLTGLLLLQAPAEVALFRAGHLLEQRLALKAYDRQVTGGNALVLIRTAPNDAAILFVNNSPWLDGDVVYAIYLDPETNRRTLQAFPHRRPWELNYRAGTLLPMASTQDMDAVDGARNYLISLREPDAAWSCIQSVAAPVELRAAILQARQEWQAAAELWEPEHPFEAALCWYKKGDLIRARGAFVRAAEAGSSKAGAWIRWLDEHASNR